MVSGRGRDNDFGKSQLQSHAGIRDRSPLRRPETAIPLMGSLSSFSKKEGSPLSAPVQQLGQLSGGGGGGGVGGGGGGQLERIGFERLRDQLYLRYYDMLQKQERDSRVVDCIVIASNRSIADYAEMVGHKVRNRGLYVDLMFLVSESSLPSALEEATLSGSAYAVVVSIQHQLHRSCTLNILQGTPEEHRNMPLLDALRLLERHFEATRGRERERRAAELPPRAAEMADDAMRGEVAGGGRAAAGGGGGGGSRNPAHVQPLLDLLAEGRQLAPLELEAVLDYVRDLRDAAMGRDGGGGGSGGGALGYPPMDEPPSRHFASSSSLAATQHHQQAPGFPSFTSTAYDAPALPGLSSSSSSSAAAAAASSSSMVLRYSLDGPGVAGGNPGNGRGHGGPLGGQAPGLDFGNQNARRSVSLLDGMSNLGQGHGGALGGGGLQRRY